MSARPIRLGAALLCLLAFASSGCSLVRRVGNHKPILRQVDPAVAFEMLRDSPGLFILDLRAANAFDGPKGHIHGAINIPLADLASRLGELSGYRDHTFLVYCDDSNCGLDGMRILVSSGFNSAILVVGGIDAWIGDGYGTVGQRPVAKSAPSSPGAPPSFKQREVVESK
ncbi:MAG TPA: rhodanese-like domain-containing protein [Thermoanaerobaculia bacterium]|nr:rhodanese-like domain-containing protein [Thermoanaerobaculia bacterium]